jgi:hypothetical protein
MSHSPWEIQFTSTDTLGLVKPADKYGTENPLVSLNGNWDIIDNIVKEILDELASITGNRTLNISVKGFNAVGDGVADDTKPFEDAIALARNIIITSGFKQSASVVIEGGIYKITRKLTISPFVRLKTKGFVLISSYVKNDSTIHFTGQNGDPNYGSVMSRQQYLRSPLINATDGGMLIKSMVAKATDNATGLELGSRTDMGAAFPVSRYSVNDVAVEGFNIGLQMNIYNHYIGTFNNLHLELNNTDVRFGTAIGNVVNSGENFSFHGGVFAGAKIGFDWLVDGMDCNFYGCSFDFVDALFNLQRGWKHINVYGGHIEGIKGGVGDNTQGIVVAKELGVAGALAQVKLYGPVVYCNNSVLFKGAFHLTCDNVRWEKITADFNNMYACETTVTVVEKQHFTQGMDFGVSGNLNNIGNSKFQKSDLTSGDAVAPFQEYTLSTNGYGTPAVTATIPTGSSYTRALKGTSTVASGNWVELKTDAYKVRPGERVQAGANVYMQGASFRNLEFKFQFYDKFGGVISTTGNYGNRTGAVTGAWQSIYGITATVPAGADTVKMYCTISQHIVGETFYLGELFVGIS